MQQEVHLAVQGLRQRRATISGISSSEVPIDILLDCKDCSVASIQVERSVTPTIIILPSIAEGLGEAGDRLQVTVGKRGVHKSSCERRRRMQTVGEGSSWREEVTTSEYRRVTQVRRRSLSF